MLCVLLVASEQKGGKRFSRGVAVSFRGVWLCGGSVVCKAGWGGPARTGQPTVLRSRQKRTSLLAQYKDRIGNPSKRAGTRAYQACCGSPHSRHTQHASDVTHFGAVATHLGAVWATRTPSELQVLCGCPTTACPVPHLEVLATRTCWKIARFFRDRIGTLNEAGSGWVTSDHVRANFTALTRCARGPGRPFPPTLSSSAMWRGLPVPAAAASLPCHHPAAAGHHPGPQKCSAP